MDDRELLEMAAKAAGIEIYFDDDGDSYRVKASENRAYWNPLQFDGDALRLAVKLQIHVQPDGRYAWASTFEVNTTEPVRGDPYAATRRAIVRAAAELARAGAQKG